MCSVALACRPKGSAPNDDGWLSAPIDDYENQDDPRDVGFAAWKRFIGPAGFQTSKKGVNTHDWHHIVEQSQYRHISVKQLNSTINLIRIPKDKHKTITFQYGRPQPNYMGNLNIPFRKWLADNEVQFATQHKWGLEMLRKYCDYSYEDQTSGMRP